MLAALDQEWVLCPTSKNLKQLSSWLKKHARSANRVIDGCQAFGALKYPLADTTLANEYGLDHALFDSGIYNALSTILHYHNHAVASTSDAWLWAVRAFDVVAHSRPRFQRQITQSSVVLTLMRMVDGLTHRPNAQVRVFAFLCTLCQSHLGIVMSNWVVKASKREHADPVARAWAAHHLCKGLVCSDIVDAEHFSLVASAAAAYPYLCRNYAAVYFARALNPSSGVVDQAVAALDAHPELFDHATSLACSTAEGEWTTTTTATATTTTDPAVAVSVAVAELVIDVPWMYDWPTLRTVVLSLLQELNVAASLIADVDEAEPKDAVLRFRAKDLVRTQRKIHDRLWAHGLRCYASVVDEGAPYDGKSEGKGEGEGEGNGSTGWPT